MAVCGARHPLLSLVRCEEPAGHTGQHGNSFYGRYWPNERPAPAWVERTVKRGVPIVATKELVK